MSVEALMPHIATIKAKVGTKDRFGQPTRAYRVRAHHPCRLSDPRGQGEVYTDRSAGVVRATHTVYLPATAERDIEESSKISEVHDANGVVLARDLQVLHVRRITGYDGAVHHVEADCFLFRDQEGP